MHLGDTVNDGAAPYGKPLDGVRILALEQMQALPWATQLLGRLGADVVKVEHPVHGESGRASRPAMSDPEGRAVGATFLRNNFSKRSVGIDVKTPEGRGLVLALAPRFDVFAENFKGGALDRMGLGYGAVAAVHPGVVYLSVSGFGNTVPSPYREWPAYAAIAEAMSGIYEYRREGDRPPTVGPVGALGDIGTALFGVIGILAALRHRDRTGVGEYIDVAMFDAMVAMTDIVTNFWSLGMRGSGSGSLITNGFRCRDGWFVLQVGREHQFARLAEIVGRPDWLDDPRLADRSGWVAHLEALIRPAIEAWASTRTKIEACTDLAAVGLAAGPCFDAEDVLADPHLAARSMLVEMPRTDDEPAPVVVPGNPVKMSRTTEGPESRVPWVGEHTEAVLREELSLGSAEIDRLRAAGVIT